MNPKSEFSNDNIQKGELLGKGSFGEVYSGYLKSSGKKIAIKRVNKKKLLGYQGQGEYLLKALKKELECMEKCNCENSVRLYTHLETVNHFNIIMELCDNDLSKELHKRPNGFSVDEVRNIMSQLNNAFKKMADNGIVHRDLKLGNILITYTDEEKTKFIPKLCDYGFSKEMNDTVTNTHLGTPATMAPEIMKGLSYNSEADLWSVGVLIYQLHFNQLPYKGKNEKEILDGILKKVPYTQPEDFFLKDLINKLLVEEPNKRLSWEEYFNHPFFKDENDRMKLLNSLNKENKECKNNEIIDDNQSNQYIDTENRYIYIRDFDTGIKSDMFKCFIGQDMKETKKEKLVIIKSYSEEFVNSHKFIFKTEFNLFRTFDKNKNVLQLINFVKGKDKNTLLIFNYVECRNLPDYLVSHDFDEKQFQIFNKVLFENVFNYSEISFKPLIFLSLYSFAINEALMPIIFDFGIHKFFLSDEEIFTYYLPNKSEIAGSLYPIKTNIMNYGITLLKCFYGNELKLNIEGNEIILPENKTMSDNMKKFLAKCLKKNISKRSSWQELNKEEIMQSVNIENMNIKEEENKCLISDKKLKGIFKSLKMKYSLINKYYDSLEIHEKTEYLNEMEKFLILTLFEQLIISKILNQSENNKYKDKNKEISFISITDEKAEEVRINFGYPVFKHMKIFNNNNNEMIKDFATELQKHINKLKEILQRFHKLTKSTFFKGNYQNFLKEFSGIMGVGISNLRDYFLALTTDANNDFLCKKYESSKLKAPIAEYLSEIVLFLVMNTIDIEKEKIFFNREELIKRFNEVFEKEDENNIEVSSIKLIQKKEKYILVSFLGILFKYLINSIDISKIEIKKNKSSLKHILTFYQKLMVTLLGVK